MPQDRLRKLTDENQELARNLKKEMDALRNQKSSSSKPASIVKRKGDSSTRGSEERGFAGPGKKRGRDFETERVSNAFNTLCCYPKRQLFFKYCEAY